MVNQSPIDPNAFRLTREWHTPCYDKLGEIGWAEGFGVIGHGARIGIRASQTGYIDALRARLPARLERYDGGQFDAVLSLIVGGPQPGSRIKRFHLAYHNHTQIARSHRLEDALDRFEAFFSVSVATLAPDHVFVHAGAVAWQGQAILLPGRSYTGKSTLVEALVRAGATYLSDEFAVLGGGDQVYPYPKPISLRLGKDGSQVDVEVGSIGGRVCRGPVPARMVVSTNFAEGAAWRPQVLSPGEGLLAMLANCPAAHHAPSRVLAALEGVASRAVVLASPRGEAADVAPQILDALSSQQGGRTHGAAMTLSTP